MTNTRSLLPLFPLPRLWIILLLVVTWPAGVLAQTTDLDVTTPFGIVWGNEVTPDVQDDQFHTQWLDARAMRTVRSQIGNLEYIPAKAWLYQKRCFPSGPCQYLVRPRAVPIVRPEADKCPPSYAMVDGPRVKTPPYTPWTICVYWPTTLEQERGHKWEWRPWPPIHGLGVPPAPGASGGGL